MWEVASISVVVMRTKDEESGNIFVKGLFVPVIGDKSVQTLDQPEHTQPYGPCRIRKSRASRVPENLAPRFICTAKLAKKQYLLTIRIFDPRPPHIPEILTDLTTIFHPAKLKVRKPRVRPTPERWPR